ncbi:unnamed protein product [Prunus armeniaca]
MAFSGLPDNSPIERSWTWQPMNVPTMKIFLGKFLQAKRPILVSLTCQMGFWIKKIGGGGWCLAGSTVFTLYEEL